MTDEDNTKSIDKRRMLAFCKEDQPEELRKILDLYYKEGDPDINFLNFQDENGYTAVHYAVLKESLDCFEMIVDEDGVDLNVQSREVTECDTPLHLAVKRLAETEDPKIILYIVEYLLEAGADPRIKNKYNATPVDLVESKYKDIREALENAADSQPKNEITADADDFVDEEEVANDDTFSSGDDSDNEEGH